MTTALATPRATRSGEIDWLLEPERPVVRRLTLLTLLHRPPHDADVRALTAGLAADPWVAPLLAGKLRDGALPAPVHAYSKWTGAHWRLFTLAELGVDVDVPGAGDAIRAALDQELAWLGSPGRRRRIKPIQGRHRNCSSQEGAGLWAAIRLGLDEDPRLEAIAERLIEIQWPDGGWNCDLRPGAHHSSFNESWMPVRALVAYRAARGSGLTGLDEAIERSLEFFLRHRVVESERTGNLASEKVGLLRWPPYWHYGLVPGLRTLAEAGRLDDPRARAGLDRLIEHRAPDGRWYPDGRYWSGSASTRSGVELVDWGRDGEARMLTLHALQLLQAAGIERGA